MKKLNKVGARFGQLPYVQAMTDVTGFGLLGHLSEMCEASHMQRDHSLRPGADAGSPPCSIFIWKRGTPGGPFANRDSYGHKIAGADAHQRNILADPQTSGGFAGGDTIRL